MNVTSAMLPDPATSQDRVFATPSAVIVLDGATAFVPVDITPNAYVDALGTALLAELTDAPHASLTEILAVAIEHTASRLSLHPGASPSSTVAIARLRGQDVDTLVLGDTQIVTPSGVIVDNRIGSVAQSERAAYQARLADGHGYDDTHRELLRALQTEQAQHRNREGGFWIAEAVPAAADHAITSTLPVRAVPWVVLATDGAYRPMRHTGLDDWEALQRRDAEGLAQLLSDLDAWESTADPSGQAFPRAKRHDDKALAVVVF